MSSTNNIIHNIANSVIEPKLRGEWFEGCGVVYLWPKIQVIKLLKVPTLLSLFNTLIGDVDSRSQALLLSGNEFSHRPKFKQADLSLLLTYSEAVKCLEKF